MKTDKDNLEDFIQQHRGLLDHDFPQDKVWQKIDQKIKPVSKSKRFDINLLWKAAAILFLVTTLILWQQNSQDSLNSQEIAVAINPEFSQIESFYFSLIEEKKEEIQGMELDISDQMKAEFFGELNSLDSAYQHLKIQLENTKNEKLVDEMIENMQLRIEILNRQLNILESIQNIKQNENQYHI
ncbi:MAG: hypothetical protein ACNS62_17175 [Candidatus Cyclobacteriaceae bacterium M3_2C_046]